MDARRLPELDKTLRAFRRLDLRGLDSPDERGQDAVHRVARELRMGRRFDVRVGRELLRQPPGRFDWILDARLRGQAELRKHLLLQRLGRRRHLATHRRDSLGRTRGGGRPGVLGGRRLGDSVLRGRRARGRVCQARRSREQDPDSQRHARLVFVLRAFRGVQLHALPGLDRRGEAMERRCARSRDQAAQRQLERRRRLPGDVGRA